jgi:MFS family permease
VGLPATERTEEAPAGPLSRRFWTLWSASTASAFGSGLTTVAAPLVVAARTDDPRVVSAGFALAWLPWLLFALPGGVLVDRVDRARLMVVIDVVRLVALGVLGALVATGRQSTAVLYAVLFLVNAGEVVFRSASQAVVPSVVPRSSLERANGWLIGGTLVMQQMVAGPVAGFLVVWAASSPFLANAGTYALSAVLVAVLALPRGRAAALTSSRTGAGTAAPRRSVLTEVVEGFAWLVRQRLLRTMAVLIGLLNVTLTAATAVLVLLARERLHLGSVGYGLLFTCMAVGGLLGSVVGDRLVRWVTATWTIRIGLLVEAGTHLALAASTDAVVVAAVLVAFGVHGSLWSIVASSLRQRLTPPGMLGRVGSTTLFVSAGGNCAGALLGGVLAARFGLTAPYWVGFVVALGVSAATWRVFTPASVAAAYAGSEPLPNC